MAEPGPTCSTWPQFSAMRTLRPKGSTESSKHTQAQGPLSCGTARRERGIQEGSRQPANHTGERRPGLWRGHLTLHSPTSVTSHSATALALTRETWLSLSSRNVSPSCQDNWQCSSKALLPHSGSQEAGVTEQSCGQASRIHGRSEKETLVFLKPWRLEDHLLAPHNPMYLDGYRSFPHSTGWEEDPRGKKQNRCRGINLELSDIV